MYFSEEIVTEKFDLIKNRFQYLNSDFEQNMQFAYNFLTGKDSVLSPIISYHSNSAFASLAELYSVNPGWTEQDNLLTKFFLSPSLNNYVVHKLPSNIIKLLDPKVKGVKAFSKIEEILLKLKIDEINYLQNLIYYTTYNNEIIDKNETYIDFVLSKLSASKTDFHKNLRVYYNSNNDVWSPIVYQLLELWNKEKADEHLLEGLEQSGFYMSRNAYTLLSMDYNKYLHIIEKIINTLDENNVSSVQTKFELKVIFFEIKENLNTIFNINEADKYLNFFLKNFATMRNENTFFRLANEFEIQHLSTFALYYIGQQKIDLFKNYIDQFYDKKIPLNTDFLEVINKYLPEQSHIYLLKALHAESNEYNKNYFYANALRILESTDKSSYLPVLWDLDKFKSKTLKSLVAVHLINHDPNPLQKSIELLKSKKAEIRLLAVFLLSNIDSSEAKETIKSAFDKEVNDDTREAMLESMEHPLLNSAEETIIQNLVEAARQRGKLNKPLYEWINETLFPPVVLKTGKQLLPEEVRFLLYRMSRAKEIRSDIEAKPILNLIDRDQSTEFAKALLKLFADKNFDIKFKFLMTLSAFTGNDEIVNKLRIAINEWIELGRKVMSEHGISALAIQGSNKALRWVEWYSRKYKNKKAFVGVAALQALQNAADELGITRHELGDRIIPDFGFDGLFKNFEAAGKEYRAFIDTNFKVAFFDENNKKIKSIPSAASNDIKDEFKELGKEVRDIVKSQSLRLEHYLIVQRKWTFHAYHKFFLENPIMFIYATKILWAVNSNDTYEKLFYCQEDTTLTDLNDEEISLSDSDEIVLAHPYFIDETILQQWKQKFFDLKIEPIFVQLERKIEKLDLTKKSKKIISEYQEKNVDSGSLLSVMDRNGWGKGATGDGGMVTDFVKDDYDSNIQAILEVDGVYVGGYGYDLQTKLGKLYFIYKNQKNCNKMWFNYPESEADERLVPLEKIPPVFYSETLADIKSIKIKENIPA